MSLVSIIIASNWPLRSGHKSLGNIIGVKELESILRVEKKVIWTPKEMSIIKDVPQK